MILARPFVMLTGGRRREIWHKKQSCLGLDES